MSLINFYATLKREKKNENNAFSVAEISFRTLKKSENISWTSIFYQNWDIQRQR